jgi:hypothetical protein
VVQGEARRAGAAGLGFLGLISLVPKALWLLVRLIPLWIRMRIARRRALRHFVAALIDTGVSPDGAATLAKAFPGLDLSGVPGLALLY